MPLRGGLPRGAARLSRGSSCLQGGQTTFESLRPIPRVRAGSIPTSTTSNRPQQRHNNLVGEGSVVIAKAKTDGEMMP